MNYHKIIVIVVLCMCTSCRLTYVKVHTLNIDTVDTKLLEHTKTLVQDSVTLIDTKLYMQPWQR